MHGPFGLAGYERPLLQHSLPRGWIDGLVLTNDTTDATNDISFSAGVCRSTVNVVGGAASTLTRDQRDIEIEQTTIKQLDVAWAKAVVDGGNRSGGCSSSALSNTTWHAYAIGGPGVQGDIIFHDSATQSSVLAILPGGYTAYRRLGSTVRASAAILGFLQFGDEFYLKTPVKDVTAYATTTTTNTALASVPTGIVVCALLHVHLAVPTSGGGTYVKHPSATDTAPSFGTAPGSTLALYSNVNNAELTTQERCWTNTSAQVGLRVTASAAIDVFTLGWIDPRGRNS